MYLFASSAFGGLSCIGLMEVFHYFGMSQWLSAGLALLVVVILSVMQNLGRYD